MNILVVLIVVILLFGAGGGYYAGWGSAFPYGGPVGYGGGIVGLILLLVVLRLLGVL